jgi:hypothetical protein
LAVIRPFPQFLDEPVAAGDANLAQSQAVERRGDQGAHVPLVQVACGAGDAALHVDVGQTVGHEVGEQAARVSVVSAGWGSDRATSLAFSARSAAAAVAPLLCTCRVLPSQSRYRVRASKRAGGTSRMVVSPTVPIVSRGRGLISPPSLCSALLRHPPLDG